MISHETLTKATVAGTITVTVLAIPLFWDVGGEEEIVSQPAPRVERQVVVPSAQYREVKSYSIQDRERRLSANMIAHIKASQSESEDDDGESCE